MKRMLVLAGLAAMGGLVFAAILLAVPPLRTPPSVIKPAAAAVRIGGPFQLTDGDGRAVTDQSFRGKWMLVYFGYTHCPDACPTALQDIASALDRLGPEARGKVVPVFITVDPERDTPAVMKSYVSAFGPAFVALSGNKVATAQAAWEYRVYAAKHPTGDGDYEMDHSTTIYVMDPQGHFVTNFTHETSPEQMASKLKQLGA